MKYAKSTLCGVAGVGLFLFVAWVAGSWLDGKGAEWIVNDTNVRTYPEDTRTPSARFFENSKTDHAQP